MIGDGQLIGRSEGRRRLEQAVDGLSGRSPAMLVTGPTGIGKSALLAEAARLSELAGRRVGWGQAGRWSGASPFRLWDDVLGQVGADVDGLFDPGPSPGGASERSTEPPNSVDLFEVVVVRLGEAARRRPVTLLLEDLDRADRTSLELFGHLVERPVDGVLVVASARPGHDHLDRLRLDRIDLGPWSISDIGLAAELRSVELDERGAAAIHARTAGNPLFVTRLLERTDPLDDSVPSDVASLVADELASLPGDTAAVLALLATAGRSSSLDVLAELSGVDPIDHLAAAVVSGLVWCDDEAAGFGSSIVQEVTYRRIDSDRRSLLHQQVAELLELRGADPGVIAGHYARAARGPRSDRTAVMARRAGSAALGAGALPEAVRYYEQAVSAQRTSGDPGDELDTILELVRALSFARRLAEAEGLLIEAEHLAATDEQRRRFLIEYTRLRWREEPNATVLRAWRLSDLAERWFVDTENPELIVAREVALVSAAEIEGITAKALIHADRALAAAREIDSTAARAEAHLARRRALMVHHDSLGERRLDALAALESAERCDDVELAGRARRLAVCDALAAGDRMAAVALMSAIGSSLSSALIEHVSLWEAGMAAMEGRTEEARTILATARDRLASSGVQSVVLEYVATAYAWDSGELGRLLAQYEPVLTTVADPTLRAGFALAAMIDRHPDVAQRHLDAALGDLLASEINPLWLLGAGAAAEVAAGLDDHRCEELYDVLAAYAGQCIVPAAAAAPFLGAVDRPLGLLSLRLGLVDRAVDHLRTSVEIHRTMQAWPWLARSHAALAAALVAAGRGAEAVEHRAEADRLRGELNMGDVLLLGDYATAARSTAWSLAEDAANEQPLALLRRVGDLWEVGLGSATGFIAPLVGLEHLARLVTDAGRDWHVLDLAGVPDGTSAAGHGGEMIDAAARDAYRARYGDLSAELDRAESEADPSRAEQARAEIAQLEDQLLAAYGLGGRPRRMDDPTERTRINVQRSVNRAVGRIRSVSPELADHLSHRVQTGRFCRYEPDPVRPVRWQL